MEHCMWRAVQVHPIQWLTVTMAPRGIHMEHLLWQRATISNGADMAPEVHPCSWRSEVPQMVIQWLIVWAVCTGLD